MDPDPNQPSIPSTDLTLALEALSATASRPEWQLLDDIDVPLTQRHLSAAIDEASLQQLLTSSPSTRARALALSTALPHAGDWLNGVPFAASISRITHSDAASDTGWGFPSTAPPTPARSAMAPLTNSETTK